MYKFVNTCKCGGTVVIPNVEGATKKQCLKCLKVHK